MTNLPEPCARPAGPARGAACRSSPGTRPASPRCCGSGRMQWAARVSRITALTWIAAESARRSRPARGPRAASWPAR